jgi:hypothetical protein
LAIDSALYEMKPNVPTNVSVVATVPTMVSSVTFVPTISASSM